MICARPLVLLGGLLLAVPMLAAQIAEDAELAVVQACERRLDPATDIGIQRIVRRCPGLLPAIERAEWRDLIPRDMLARREDVTAGSLRALIELVRRAPEAPVLREAPRRADLDAILGELEDPTAKRAGGWERLKRWFKSKLETRRNSESGWADELLAELRNSEGFARMLTWLGYLLVAILMLYVIWAELRAAGLWDPVRRAQRRAAAVAAAKRISWPDVMAAAPPDRPGLLLRLLGEALTRARRLPAADSLTATTIARRAELASEEDRAALAELASVADRVRYAPRAPSDEAVQQAVTSGHALLTKIQRLPPGAA